MPQPQDNDGCTALHSLPTIMSLIVASHTVGVKLKSTEGTWPACRLQSWAPKRQLSSPSILQGEGSVLNRQEWTASLLGSHIPNPTMHGHRRKSEGRWHVCRLQSLGKICQLSSPSPGTSSMCIAFVRAGADAMSCQHEQQHLGQVRMSSKVTVLHLQGSILMACGMSAGCKASGSSPSCQARAWGQGEHGRDEDACCGQTSSGLSPAHDPSLHRVSLLMVLLDPTKKKTIKIFSIRGS